MSDFLHDELARRGLDVTATVLRIEERVKSATDMLPDKLCPSKVKYRGELLECMDKVGHKACHFHLNVIWK